MSSSKSSPRKRLPSLAQVARPDVRYAVQAALVGQKPKIYLIDPATNLYLDGLMNAPAIYLTHTPPGLPKQATRKGMGFIPRPPEEIASAQEEIKVDATLFFIYPDQEIFSGYDEKTGMTVMVIQVWHDAEIPSWRRIAQKVASGMAIVKRSDRIPTVFFYITSAFVPNDPNEPHQLIIKPNSYNECTNAISKRFPNQEDDYYEDE